MEGRKGERVYACHKLNQQAITTTTAAAKRRPQSCQCCALFGAHSTSCDADADGNSDGDGDVVSPRFIGLASRRAASWSVESKGRERGHTHGQT